MSLLFSFVHSTSSTSIHSQLRPAYACRYLSKCEHQACAESANPAHHPVAQAQVSASAPARHRKKQGCEGSPPHQSQWPATPTEAKAGRTNAAEHLTGVETNSIVRSQLFCCPHSTSTTIRVVIKSTACVTVLEPSEGCIGSSNSWPMDAIQGLVHVNNSMGPKVKEARTWPAASAAVDPPEDPPGVSFVSQGLRVVPNTCCAWQRKHTCQWSDSSQSDSAA